jgi:hypothetical protein
MSVTAYSLPLSMTGGGLLRFTSLLPYNRDETSQGLGIVIQVYYVVVRTGG